METKIILGRGESRLTEIREADQEHDVDVLVRAVGICRADWGPEDDAWCVIVGGDGSSLEESDLDADPAVVAYCRYDASDDDDDAKDRIRDAQIRHAILYTCEASCNEQDALLEIFHVEGFGGREYNVTNMTEAEVVALDRLTWLREQREAGTR